MGIAIDNKNYPSDLIADDYFARRGNGGDDTQLWVECIIRYLDELSKELDANAK